jgi:hypothetical protein
METRFKLLDGVVDTDTYYNNINFPFLWTGGDGEFFIAKGTPLVQVIPFRRESHELEVSATDLDKRKSVISTLGTKLKNGYRDELWHGKKSKEEDAPSIKANLHERTDGIEVATEGLSIAQPDAPTDAELLHQNGYVVLRNMITQENSNLLTQGLRKYIEETGAQPDATCPSSKYVKSMPELDELLERITPVVSGASGKNLIPTYSYARMYVNGEMLPKHFDRPACQYSITLCLGMDSDPWPIFMAKKSDSDSGTPYTMPDGSVHYMGEPTAAHLNVGDGVLYLGMDMVHYREPFEGQWQAQVFLHWVDADGPHADQKYDGRLALSHHSVAVNVDDNVIPLSASSAMSSGILEVVADDSGRGFTKNGYRDELWHSGKETFGGEEA